MNIHDHLIMGTPAHAAFRSVSSPLAVGQAVSRALGSDAWLAGGRITRGSARHGVRFHADLGLLVTGAA